MIYDGALIVCVPTNKYMPFISSNISEVQKKIISISNKNDIENKT